MLVPKLVTTLRGYTRAQFTADLTAGVIVGIVALPLAIAFAIASGVTPDRGLWTAIIAGFLISALGGSRVQIGGPTGAFVVIVYGIVQAHGIDGLILATVMAGVMLIIMGVVRLGAAIKFIPFPVTTGFTSGIAVVIASSQVRDLLGLSMPDVPAEFVEKWAAYGEHITTVNPHALLVAGVALAITVGWPRVSRTIPAPLVAIDSYDHAGGYEPRPFSPDAHRRPALRDAPRALKPVASGLSGSRGGYASPHSAQPGRPDMTLTYLQACPRGIGRRGRTGIGQSLTWPGLSHRPERNPRSPSTPQPDVNTGS